MPAEAGMLCTIDGDTFYSFAKNTGIGDLTALCHITNDNTGLFNLTNKIEVIQESLGNMPTITKKSFASMSDKLTVLNRCILYGL